MSDGSEFQVCGAATENARRANSVRVLAADSIGAKLVADLQRAEMWPIPIIPNLRPGP